LFESLAESCKEYAITVILTGTGIDGSNTLKTVKALKGTVIAQDEATSEFLGMPGAAIQTGFVDYVLSLQDIAPLLLHLVTIEKAE
jgi:two-component system chemotaxis response regulator CheB